MPHFWLMSSSKITSTYRGFLDATAFGFFGLFRLYDLFAFVGGTDWIRVETTEPEGTPDWGTCSASAWLCSGWCSWFEEFSATRTCFSEQADGSGDVRGQLGFIFLCFEAGFGLILMWSFGIGGCVGRLLLATGAGLEVTDGFEGEELWRPTSGFSGWASILKSILLTFYEQLLRQFPCAEKVKT